MRVATPQFTHSSLASQFARRAGPTKQLGIVAAVAAIFLASSPALAESGAKEYAKWLEAYDEVFTKAIRPIVDRIQMRIIEHPGFINAEEEQALTKLAGVRPQTSADRAYAIWLEKYAAHVKEIPGLQLKLSENQRAYLRRFAANAPGVSDESAYLAWYQAQRVYVEKGRSGLITDNSAFGHFHAQLSEFEKVRPKAFGSQAYVVWISDFVPFLEKLGERSRKTETARVEYMLSIKPCHVEAVRRSMKSGRESRRSKLDPPNLRASSTVPRPRHVSSSSAGPKALFANVCLAG